MAGLHAEGRSANESKHCLYTHSLKAPPLRRLTAKRGVYHRPPPIRAVAGGDSPYPFLLYKLAAPRATAEDIFESWRQTGGKQLSALFLEEVLPGKSLAQNRILWPIDVLPGFVDADYSYKIHLPELPTLDYADLGFNRAALRKQFNDWRREAQDKLKEQADRWDQIVKDANWHSGPIETKPTKAQVKLAKALALHWMSQEKLTWQAIKDAEGVDSKSTGTTFRRVKEASELLGIS